MKCIPGADTYSGFQCNFLVYMASSSLAKLQKDMPTCHLECAVVKALKKQVIQVCCEYPTSGSKSASASSSPAPPWPTWSTSSLRIRDFDLKEPFAELYTGHINSILKPFAGLKLHICKALQIQNLEGCFIG